MYLYLSNWFQRNYGIIQQARGRQLCMQFNRCQNPCEKLVYQGWGQTRHLTHSFYRGLLNTCFGLHCSSCWGQSSEQHSKNSLHSSDGRYNKPDNSVKKKKKKIYALEIRFSNHSVVLTFKVSFSLFQLLVNHDKSFPILKTFKNTSFWRNHQRDFSWHICLASGHTKWPK